MVRRDILVPATVLLAVCVVGGLLTRHSHGFKNMLSNIFFFAPVLLVLVLATAGAIALVRAWRRRRDAQVGATRS